MEAGSGDLHQSRGRLYAGIGLGGYCARVNEKMMGGRGYQGLLTFLQSAWFLTRSRRHSRSSRLYARPSHCHACEPHGGLCPKSGNAQRRLVPFITVTVRETAVTSVSASSAYCPSSPNLKYPVIQACRKYTPAPTPVSTVKCPGLALVQQPPSVAPHPSIPSHLQDRNAFTRVP